MDMVEKVATALAESMNGGMFSSPKFYNGDQREVWRQHARTVIAAMRDPTPEMHGRNDPVAIVEMSKVYSYMIDGALKTSR